MTVPRTLEPDDAPPIDSIIVDNGNDAWQLRGRNKWHMACMGMDTYSLSFLIEHYSPITLIWEPPIT